MSKIYIPGEKAKEYCGLAVNLYTGCNHGCLYCYAPSANQKPRKDYLIVRPTSNTIRNIERESHLYKGKEILLCFLTDPYNSLDKKLKLTRQAIEILRANEVIPVILTKAGRKSMRDFDLLDGSCWYGATLTFVNDKDSQAWEPHASLPLERIEVLKEAKKKGISTWVSLEPVIYPEQTIELVHMTHEFVNHYKFGKWNHDKRANDIDWSKFLSDMRTVMKKYGIKEMTNVGCGKGFYVKSELKGFAEK